MQLNNFELNCLKDLINRTVLTRGSQFPNPAVGAMVINNQSIISEGYHSIAGTDHAEAIALNQASGLTKGATLLITLEPCSHEGKTPPCVKRIIAAGIKRVIWAINDPNPKVYGKSKAILEESGIDVIENALPEEGKQVIKEFYEYHTYYRPYIYVKAAMSLDGFVAPNSQGLHYISNQQSLNLVHQLRTYVQAICVGVNTINIDQPRLTVRLDNRIIDFQPAVVILDPHSKLDYKWVRTAIDKGREVIVFSSKPSQFESERFYNYSILGSDKSKNWSLVFKKLFDHKIQSVLVEGGSNVFHSIFQSGYFNEFWVTKVPQLFKSEMAIPFLSSSLDSSLDLSLYDVNILGSDVVMRYKNNNDFHY